MCCKNVKKISHLLSLSDVFFQAPNTPKPDFGRGSASDPTPTGELTMLPSLPGWLGTPTHTLPLDSFGISICPHPIKIPGYVYVLVNIIDNARLIRRNFDNLTTFVNFDNLTIPGNYHFTIKKLTSDWLH